ncbi:Cytochrome oxidase complex assembly protein 1 [compost metagenome]
MIKSSDAYQEALSRAKASPAVISALGSPVKEGFYVSGSINVSGPSGDAKLAIPVSGPKGEGTIYLEARKSADVWSYSVLVVRVTQTRQRIDLLREKRN